MKKVVYCLLVLLTLIGYSCDSPQENANEGETTTTTTTGDEGTDVEVSTTPPTVPTTTGESVGASKITEAIIEEVCACKQQSLNTDGSIDREKMVACMGAPSLPDYVKQVLGSSATDKERSDAEAKLDKRMKAC